MQFEIYLLFNFVNCFLCLVLLFRMIHDIDRLLLVLRIPNLFYVGIL